MGNDLEADGTFRIITEFPAQPYYFATTKGNKEVLEGLDHALGKIADNIPDFNEKHSSQFAVQESTQILLTQEEKEYVANTGSVKVAVIPDFHPFFCIGSEDSHDGIIPTVLKEVEKSS
ncbi:molecular chaperone Hsp90, partial [Enterocloster bolteae]|nr:molecular chaperone Hsp90 [Enterocloster bolteae]